MRTDKGQIGYTALQQWEELTSLFLAAPSGFGKVNSHPCQEFIQGNNFVFQMLFLPVFSGYVMPDPLTYSFCPDYSYFKHLKTKSTTEKC